MSELSYTCSQIHLAGLLNIWCLVLSSFYKRKHTLLVRLSMSGKHHQYLLCHVLDEAYTIYISKEWIPMKSEQHWKNQAKFSLHFFFLVVWKPFSILPLISPLVPNDATNTFFFFFFENIDTFSLLVPYNSVLTYQLSFHLKALF